MKKSTGKRIIRIFLICLATVCVLASLGSLLAFGIAENFGMYQPENQDSYEKSLSGQQKNLELAYAATMIENDNYALLNDSNMNYMIVQAGTEKENTEEKVLYTSPGASSNNADFRQKANCLEILSTQESIINEQNILSSLWRSQADTLVTEDSDAETNYHTITDIYYYENTDCFYYRTDANSIDVEGYLFPVNKISISNAVYYERNGYQYYSNIDGSIFQTARLLNGTISHVWFDNYYCNTDEIHKISQEIFQKYLVCQDYHLPSINQTYSSEGGITPFNISIRYIATETPEEDAVRYLVYADLKQNLQKNGQDFFYEQQQLNRFLFQYRYHFIWCFIITAILGIVAVFLYLHSIFRQKPDNALIRQVPLIVLIGFFALATALNITILSFYIDNCFYVSNGILPLYLAGCIICVIAESILAILFLGECTARLRDGVLLKNTLCYYLLRLCRKYIKKLIEALPLYPRAALCFLAISIAEFIVIAIGDTGITMTLFLLFKLVETPVLCLTIIQIHQLQNTVKQMAEGNLEHHINTDKMLPACKKHGNYLNQIADGINLAVEERLKSEHFKTELITNVSHDIKTPLTSIVNYVDLLQKEGISNEEREEYIQVLDRQSARLKKLIDDLMDASKASTGNVEMHLEKCDVGIMMVQTLGEYEEKMTALDLNLIAAAPSEVLLVRADSRHLWRIFDNLLNNICKYSQPGTRVYVNQESEENQVKIIFRNTSKYPLNLSSEELMERFIRGDSSRHTEGSGLGLSIAKNLTELMQGSFELTTDGDLFKVIIILPKIS